MDTINLFELWCALRKEWFPDRPDLDDYEVRWSRRPQTRTLASCNLDDRRVNVARELNELTHRVWLKPLLYHEMCHAYLGRDVEHHRGGRAWHGPKFKALEQRHPLTHLLTRWIKVGGWARAVRERNGR